MRGGDEFATALLAGVLAIAALVSIGGLVLALSLDDVAPPIASTAPTTTETTTTTTETTTTTTQLQCNSTADPAIAPCVNRTCNAPGVLACAVSGPACACVVV